MDILETKEGTHGFTVVMAKYYAGEVIKDSCDFWVTLVPRYTVYLTKKPDRTPEKRSQVFFDNYLGACGCFEFAGASKLSKKGEKDV